ncbi:hypothetical protein KL86DYS2_10148 [uncultured Dysgonomonas sp.]|uniref:Uncharacterized protein n=1 Tax=uncultured Dysgonomonas sp. TaxID=206096 RepID=A0A212IVJ2_9BACT|nr:hypothetical protein KL86DYS2_10148 [uncultured Dysgonomonas sp.]
MCIFPSLNGSQKTPIEKMRIAKTRRTVSFFINFFAIYSKRVP